MRTNSEKEREWGGGRRKNIEREKQNDRKRYKEKAREKILTEEKQIE